MNKINWLQLIVFVLAIPFLFAGVLIGVYVELLLFGYAAGKRAVTGMMNTDILKKRETR